MTCPGAAESPVIRSMPVVAIGVVIARLSQINAVAGKAQPGGRFAMPAGALLCTAMGYLWYI
jgi:hypothetical protein